MANYFVSYSWANKTQSGNGCLSIKAQNGIRNAADIDEIIKVIKAQNPDLGDVVIINWQRFEEEDDHGEK